MKLIKLKDEFYLINFDFDNKEGDMCLWLVQHEWHESKALVNNSLFHSKIIASTKKIDGVPLLDRDNVELQLNKSDYNKPSKNEWHVAVARNFISVEVEPLVIDGYCMITRIKS